MSKTFRIATALIALAASGAQAADLVIASPDGSIALRIADDASSFSVSRRGEAVITPSPLGLELEGQPAIGLLKLESRQDMKEDRVIPLIATKAATARDHYVGATLGFREAGGGRRVFIDARAYDDGVAFRYRFEGDGPVKVRSERTAFVPAGDPPCLLTPVDGGHEAQFERLRISQLKADASYDVPVVCATPSGRTHYAITQAHLQGYTGASFRREGDGLRLQLSQVPGREGAAVVSATGLTTAWRAVMMADRAGDLIPSQLVGNLNPAPTGDFSWVKPGKTSWDWWSGPLEGVKPDLAAYKRFIDFAAESGFSYHLIDAGWSFAAGPCCEALPTTDIARAADGIDMPALVRYAADKGVGLLLWVHWQHLAPRIDEVLDTYARWGIKGIKVDFMNRDDQDMVAFYQRVAEATAKRHLLLDLHGAYVPAGLQRSYPNFITQEGVLGAEWNKMDKRVTPRHNLMLPYTRMLTGPMDYTPGGFRNATPQTFEVRAVMPLTQSTRGQALAMYVVYDSPLQMVSDDPSNYRGEAGFDFIRQVPTTWDETRFIAGEPGQDIVLARRHGKTWYLGAMTSDQARTEKVSLGFLPPGKWKATVWQDGEGVREVQRTQRTVTRQEALNLVLSAAGGAAVVLEPMTSN